MWQAYVGLMVLLEATTAVTVSAIGGGVVLVLLGLLVYLGYRLIVSPPSEGVWTGDGRLTAAARRTIEGVIALSLGVAGVGGALAGWALGSLTDREGIEDVVESEGLAEDISGVESFDVTEAEVVDIAETVVQWTGLGLFVAGLVMLVAGVVIGRRLRRTGGQTEEWRADPAGAQHGPAREPRRESVFEEAPAERERAIDPSTTAGPGSEETATGGVLGVTTSNALVGALATTVASVVPFSGVVGGGVAGYLQQEGAGAGARTGGLAGLLLGLPTAIVALSVAVGLFLADAATIGSIVLFGGAMVLGFNAAMSALGGALGGYIADSSGQHGQMQGAGRGEHQ